MAQMLPPYISPLIKSRGEKYIFDRLLSSHETEDWIVLHSLNISQHVTKPFGEIDFVVIAPNLGIFCLEIKSGEIRRKNGVWQYINRYGKITETSRGPEQQAVEGMYSLRNYVKSRFGSTSKFSRLLYGYGLVFPDVVFDYSDLSIDRNVIYDASNNSRTFKEYIVSLSNFFQEKYSRNYWFKVPDSIPSKEDAIELKNALRADFDFYINPKDKIRDYETEILKYTTEQYRILDQLQENERCLIEGSAGCGKTTLATESFRRVLALGNQTLLVSFNSQLGKYLNISLQEELAASSTDSYVGSFHQFLANKVGAAGENIVTGNSFFKKELPEKFAYEFISKKMKKFDALIIDEGQDLISDVYLKIFDLILKDGLSNGQWKIFADFEKQSIYSDIGASEMKSKLSNFANFARFKLIQNCRNTKQIGTELMKTCSLNVEDFVPSKIEGDPVDFHYEEGREKVLKKLTSLLKEMINCGIPQKRISVLCPDLKILNEVKKTLTSQNVEFIENPYDLEYNTDNEKIIISTIHGYKGLENSYVILVGMTEKTDSYNEDLQYIGISRAKLKLDIIAESKTVT